MSDRLRYRMRTTGTAAHPRRGTVTVLVLLCLLVVVSLAGTMLQSALRARRQLQTERDFRQAELLLQAGLERAAYRLATEPDYCGETWEPGSQALAGRGRILIETKSLSAGESSDVNVVAEFPFGSPRSIRRSHAFPYIPSQPRAGEQRP